MDAPRVSSRGGKNGRKAGLFVTAVRLLPHLLPQGVRKFHRRGGALASPASRGKSHLIGLPRTAAGVSMSPFSRLVIAGMSNPARLTACSLIRRWNSGICARLERGIAALADRGDERAVLEFDAVAAGCARLSRDNSCALSRRFYDFQAPRHAVPRRENLA